MSKVKTKMSTDDLLGRAERLARKDHGGRFSIEHGDEGYRAWFGETGVEPIFGPSETLNQTLDVMLGTTIHDKDMAEPWDTDTARWIAEAERDEERLSAPKTEDEL